MNHFLKFSTALLLITCTIVSAKEFETESIAASPDRKVELVRSKSIHVSDEFDYYTKDVRNNRELAPLPTSVTLWGKVYVTWWADSCAVSLTCGEEKSWGHWFLILRRDAKSGFYFWDEPNLPDLESLIHKNTSEKDEVFKLVTRPTYKPDEIQGSLVEQFGAQLPQFEGYSVGMVGFDEKNPMPKNQFVMDYTQLERNGSSGDGSTQEGGLVYHFLFETNDWVRYKLLKITRSGSPPQEAIYPDAKPDVPVTLYPQPSKPGDEKERKPTEKPAADGEKKKTDDSRK